MKYAERPICRWRLNYCVILKRLFLLAVTIPRLAVVEPVMALQLVRTTLFSLVFVSIIDSSLSVSKLDLFPYGYAVDQKLVEENEDFNSAELTLTTPIVFYQQTYNSIHVRHSHVFFYCKRSIFNYLPRILHPLISRSMKMVWFLS